MQTLSPLGNDSSNDGDYAKTVAFVGKFEGTLRILL